MTGPVFLAGLQSPTLPLTKKKIAKRIEKLRQHIIFLESIPTGCEHCVSFDGHGCQRADGLIPPSEVIQQGCPKWRWDGIPF